MRTLLKTTAVLFTLLFLQHSLANTTDAGQYQINHIAYNSTFLERDIAKLYGITRAKNLAVINISVQDLENEGKGVDATITGTATNLIHQIKHLKFRKVPSGDAIYYISDYRFSDGDALTFKLDVTVPGASRPTEVEWQQTFYKQ